MADQNHDKQASSAVTAATMQPHATDDLSPEEKRGFKIHMQVDTFQEASPERQKFFGDAKGKAAFNEFYWSMARDMTVMTNNMDVMQEEIKNIMKGEDCLAKRVLLHQPNDASPEQAAKIHAELNRRVMQGESEKAARGEGVDDNGKWWEKFGQPVGRYEEED